MKTFQQWLEAYDPRTFGDTAKGTLNYGDIEQRFIKGQEVSAARKYASYLYKFLKKAADLYLKQVVYDPNFSQMDTDTRFKKFLNIFQQVWPGEYRPPLYKSVIVHKFFLPPEKIFGLPKKGYNPASEWGQQEVEKVAINLSNKKGDEAGGVHMSDKGIMGLGINLAHFLEANDRKSLREELDSLMSVIYHEPIHFYHRPDNPTLRSDFWFEWGKKLTNMLKYLSSPHEMSAYAHSAAVIYNRHHPREKFDLNKMRKLIHTQEALNIYPYRFLFDVMADRGYYNQIIKKLGKNRLEKILGGTRYSFEDVYPVHKQVVDWTSRYVDQLLSAK